MEINSIFVAVGAEETHAYLETCFISHMVKTLSFDFLHSGVPVICSLFMPHKPEALSFISDIKPDFSEPEALAFDE